VPGPFPRTNTLVSEASGEVLALANASFLGTESAHGQDELTLPFQTSIQDASDLALSLKCSPHPFILLGALQRALIFQCEACSVISDPHVDYGVVVLLVRDARSY